MTGKPLILGLTGSIGMGKSTVAAMFAEQGVPVFDADAAVHRLQGPGGRLVAAIESLHPGTTGPDGVDRAKLSAAVLGNPAALRALEQLVHPAVGEDRAEFLRRHADALDLRRQARQRSPGYPSGSPVVPTTADYQR